MKENMYATLPKSLREECLVRSREEDPDVVRERQRLVQSMSVSELAKVSGLSDIPLPKFRSRSRKGDEKPKEERFAIINLLNVLQTVTLASFSRPTSPMSESMYATLPKTLTQELHVRSKVAALFLNYPGIRTTN